MAGWKLATVAALLAASAGAARIVATNGGGPDWGMIGNDSENSRNAPHEQTIRPDNVNQLRPRWIATTTGNISATPAVVDGAVYIGDFGGTVSAGVSTGARVTPDPAWRAAAITSSCSRSASTENSDCWGYAAGRVASAASRSVARGAPSTAQ